MCINKAIKYVIDNEGGFVDNEHDMGGVTNFGLSMRFLKSFYPEIDITYKWIKNLTFNKAYDIYKSAWWNAYNYGKINNRNVAAKILDMAVNIGPTKAGKIVQKALNDCTELELIVDGILGSKSMASLNNEKVDKDQLMKNIIKQLIYYYIDIVINTPSQLVFLKGWINRAFKEPNLC